MIFFMSLHLAVAFDLYLPSLVLLTWLSLKLRHSPWTVFRVFILWLLVSNFFLTPFAWHDFVLYSILSWQARCITLALAAAVAGEIWQIPLVGALCGSSAGLLLAWSLTHRYSLIPGLWRGSLAAIALAAGLRLVRHRRDLIALGLVVFTLPAAALESPSVMQQGGWLRLVPTVSAWAAFTLWLWSWHNREVEIRPRPASLRLKVKGPR
jgi:hypothetical protein